MKYVAAGNYGSRFFVDVDPDVVRLKSVDVESECIQEICQFTGSFEIERLGKPEFRPYLQQSFYHFDRSETLCRISISCHEYPLLTVGRGRRTTIRVPVGVPGL